VKVINYILRYTLYAILLAVVAGCAAPPLKPTGDFYWPPPPDPPRIKWLTWWSSEYDFGRPSPILTFLIGEEGRAGLRRPNGVVADSAGNVYVADSDQRVIIVFDIERNTLRFLGEGLFYSPVALAIDNRNGVLYVTDTKQNSVVGIDKKTGRVVMNFGAPGELKRPAAIAFDEERGRIYISDTKEHHIKVYDRNGKYLFTIGKRGGGEGEFNFPTHISFKHGKLYVNDSMNYRVQILDPDGRFLKQFGKLGDAPGQFSRPKGIDVDSEGHIYVVDTAFNNFQIFDENGQLLLWVGHTGARDPGGFQLPSGLYIDQQDRIYVADTFNRRVQVFQYLKEK